MTKIMMRESLVKEVQPTSKDLIKTPVSDLVVTLSKNGEALSVFSDDIWDYSATSNTLKTINFKSKIQSQCTSNTIDNHKFNLAVRFEPPRYCRRLNILREYDNEKTNLHS